MTGPFDKVEKADQDCPRCGGELLKVTRPVNVQVFQCQGCEEEFGEEYLSGWKDCEEALRKSNRGGFENIINSYNQSKQKEYQAGLANFTPMLFHYYKASIISGFNETQALYLTKEYAETLIRLSMDGKKKDE